MPDDTLPDDTLGPDSVRRRLVVTVTVVVVLVAIVALIVLVSGDGDGDVDGPAASATSTSSGAALAPASDDSTSSASNTSGASSTTGRSADPSTAGDEATGEPTATLRPVPTSSASTGVTDPSATPSTTQPTPDINDPPPTLPEVPLDEPGVVGNGIVATIIDIEAIDGTATGPGNIAGPALRISIRIENGTDEAVSLDAVSVNLSYGVDRTPGSPLDDPSQVPFVGTIEPGANADAGYVFSVPLDARDIVTVEVGYAAGAPLLIFSGPAT